MTLYQRINGHKIHQALLIFEIFQFLRQQELVHYNAVIYKKSITSQRKDIFSLIQSKLCNLLKYRGRKN